MLIKTTCAGNAYKPEAIDIGINARKCALTLLGLTLPKGRGILPLGRDTAKGN